MSNVTSAVGAAVRTAKGPIPQTANAVLALAQISLTIYQLFVLPLYLLPKSAWWAAVIVPIGCLNNPYWALIHEAIHDVFHPSARINLAAGRLMSLFFGAPFQILRVTHLSHHKFNRSPLEKGTEIYDEQATSRFVASIKYYGYIVCGLYLLEAFSGWIFFLPPKQFYRLGQRMAERGDLQERWLAAKFMDKSRQREIRIDSVVIMLLIALSAFCYRGHWLVFFGMLGLRTFLISFMDNVYHYRTPLNLTVSGHNLSLPYYLSRALLHFNFHRTHHTHPSAPWTQIPELLASDADRCDRSLWAAAVDQFSGPISLAETAWKIPLTCNADSQVDGVAGMRA